MKHFRKYFGSLIAMTVLLPLFCSCNNDEELLTVNPKAGFTYEISSENPYVVKFTSTMTDRKSWVWDFGDGEVATIAHPTHTYKETGAYTVTLTAIGEPGSTPVVITQNIVIALSDPIASFSYLASTANPLEIKFNTISTYTKSFVWDFGDGKVSTEKSPIHLYEAAGRYTVKLTATGFEGTTPVVVTQDINVGVVLMKLVGTVIGHASSYNDNPATYITAAFDGNMSTFVDAPSAIGFVGYDFGKTVTLQLVKFAPRFGFEGRMVNGEIRGSNDPLILTNPAAATFQTLYKITQAPAVGTLTEVPITAPQTYRFIYFYSTDYCNISELEFWGGKGDFSAVAVENADFELPGTVKQKNWSNVPGWNSDTPAADSGVEGSTSSGWNGYKMSSDPSVYNLTNHVITADEEFKINVKAWDSWHSSKFIVTLYYDTGNGVRNVLAAQTFDIGLTNTFELIANASSRSVGAKLGIMFDNLSIDSGAGWAGFDNVQLFAR